MQRSSNLIVTRYPAVMNDNSPPANHPAVQSAIYHLTLALIRSGSLKPAELTADARRGADEGKLNDPDIQTW